MIDTDTIQLEVNKDFDRDQILELYKLNHCSSADKPELLFKALQNSHKLWSSPITKTNLLDWAIHFPMAIWLFIIPIYLSILIFRDRALEK